MTVEPKATITLALLTQEADKGDNRKQWVHLVPAGRFSGIDGRGPWFNTAPDKVIAATRRYFGQRQIPVDYEHQVDRAPTNGQPAPAAGWVVGLDARPDGIWGLVEWNERAAQFIANREYRYISPVFHHQKDNGTVTMLLRAGLTNTPALDQLTPVAATRKEGTSNMDEQQLQELRQALGLNATADFAAILTAIKGALAASTSAATAEKPDPAKYVPIGDFQRAVADANSLRQGITVADAKRHVEAHITSGLIAPFMKDWAVELCTVNKPAFDKFVEGIGPSVIRIVTPQLGAIGSSPPGRASNQNQNLTETELEVCSNLGLTAEQFNKARDASTER